MTLNYEFDFLKCRSCTQKTHCEQCAEELRQLLLNTDGVTDASVTIPGYRMTIVTTGADRDDIEEMLEDNAVFV